MPAGSTNTMASTNPTLTNLFTSLFGGTNGAGATGVGTLSSIAGGQNLTALNTALTANNASATAQGVAGLKEAFGSSGMGSSSSLLGAISKYQVNQQNTLTQNLASADLQAQGQQLSAANYLTSIFSSSANQYFNNSSSSFNPLQLIQTILG